jgi:indole-3-glycerol phosphate synthase
VAESGVTSAADAAGVARSGYEMALVGSALMQGATPVELAGDMLREGRAARRARACG